MNRGQCIARAVRPDRHVDCDERRLDELALHRRNGRGEFTRELSKRRRTAERKARKKWYALQPKLKHTSRGA